MRLEWTRCDSDVWCSLERVDLRSVNTLGVYVIWISAQRQGTNVVYVGQGDIADRVNHHRSPSSEVLAYRQYGDLLVTWAAVDYLQRNGVEAYLAARFKPLVGSHPSATPVEVNLP